MNTKRIPPLDRFLAFIELAGDCWVWTGCLKNGYAQFNPGGDGGMVSAHIWSYKEFIGAIPKGLELDHVCRVRRCVNPFHLEPVTRTVNIRRGVAARNPKGICKRGHPLDGKSASGWRYCLTCNRNRFKAWYDTKRLTSAEAT